MKIIAQILKITTLVCFFTLILQISAFAVSVKPFNNGKTSMSEVENTSGTSGNNNKYKYKNSEIELLGSVGAALATNVGIQYTKNQVANSQLVGQLSTLGIEKNETVQGLTQTAGNAEHMQVIQEYYNLLATDIKTLIGSAADKASTLSSFTNQLEHRYKLASTNITTLNNKKAQHIQELERIDAQVTNIKAKINNDFKNFDARSTDKNITAYLSLKGEYDFHRTHVIFINQYIKQYSFLNNYNKKVLDVLITNRNAIIKSAYVVIPDTGSQVLRDMNLLITEQEFKGE